MLGVVNMKPGDKVEVEITGLGVLQNTIAADEKRRLSAALIPTADDGLLQFGVLRFEPHRRTGDDRGEHDLCIDAVDALLLNSLRRRADPGHVSYL